MTRVKICGIRSIEEAQSVLAAGADALGFHVELEGSKYPLGASTASLIIAQLPPFVSSVVVTTETDPKALIRIAKATWANTLQLHGDASPDTINAIKAVMPYLKVIAVVHVSDESALELAKRFEESADAIILDSSGSSKRGGTGETHDWSISRKIVDSLKIPVILAGGLNPENVAEAVRTVHPFAVDVNSGVSNPDGTKNIEKVKAFIAATKSA